MRDCAQILLLALALDALLGDPPALYRKVPHPVVLLGRLVARLESALNGPRLTATARRLRGAATVGLVVIAAAGVGAVLATLLARVPGGAVLEALLASVLLAGRGLYEAVAAVGSALGQGLEQGRRAVAHVVGRDPEGLDEAGVARAAIESLAENFSDGLVAPACWYLLAGLPGLAAYKAVNTLDSMIGHRGERYGAFGTVAARLDDAVNWLPARLAGLAICAGAFLTPGASAVGAWRAMWRDARRHRSPNAGWQEAAVAGALDLALAGPRVYATHRVDDPWMGGGRTAAGARDVAHALRLYLAAAGTLAALVAVVAVP